MFNFLNEKFQKVSVLKKQIFVTLILTLICLGIRLSLDIIVSGLSFMGILDDLFASFIAFIVTFILCIFTSDKYAKYIFVFGTSLVFYQAARSIPDLSAPLVLLLNLVLVTIVIDVKVVILQGIITIVGQIFLVIVDIPGSFDIGLYTKLMITGVTAFISFVVIMAIKNLCNNMEKVKDTERKRTLWKLKAENNYFPIHAYIENRLVVGFNIAGKKTKYHVYIAGFNKPIMIYAYEDGDTDLFKNRIAVIFPVIKAE